MQPSAVFKAISLDAYKSPDRRPNISNVGRSTKKSLDKRLQGFGSIALLVYFVFSLNIDTLTLDTAVKSTWVLKR